MASQDIADLIGRLTPDVQHIVRLDLIQAVGNALRYRRNAEADRIEIEAFADRAVVEESIPNWASW